MKYFSIGVGILAVILALSLISLGMLGRQTEKVASLLDQALAAGDKNQAAALARQARSEWEKSYGLIATVVDHQGLDCVTTGFAELAGWAEAGEEAEFANTCRSLAAQVRMIYRAERPTYYNIM